MTIFCGVCQGIQWRGCRVFIIKTLRYICKIIVQIQWMKNFDNCFTAKLTKSIGKLLGRVRVGMCDQVEQFQTSYIKSYP